MLIGVIDNRSYDEKSAIPVDSGFKTSFKVIGALSPTYLHTLKAFGVVAVSFKIKN